MFYFYLEIPNKKVNDQYKTTITKISRRRSTIDQDSLNYSQSAPSSPALIHINKQRLNHNKISLETIENVCF